MKTRGRKKEDKSEADSTPAATTTPTRKTRASKKKEEEAVTDATPKAETATTPTRKTRASRKKGADTETETTTTPAKATRGSRGKGVETTETDATTASTATSAKKTRTSKRKGTEAIDGTTTPEKNKKEIKKEDNKKIDKMQEVKKQNKKIQGNAKKSSKKEDDEDNAKEDNTKETNEVEEMKNEDNVTEENEKDEMKEDQNENDEAKENEEKEDNDVEMKNDSSEKDTKEKIVIDDNETTEKEIAANDDENNQEEKTTKNIIDRTENRVVVHNVLKFTRKKNELEEDINSWLSYAVPKDSIKIFSYKKPPCDNFVKITLEHVDMVQPFLQIFKQNKLKNRKGFDIYAARPNDTYSKKRSRDDDVGNKDENTNNKRMRNEIVDIRDVTIPLHKMTYEEQLVHKQKQMIKECASRIVKELQKGFKMRQKMKKHDPNIKLYPVYKWLKGKNAIKISEIIPSPEKYQYRNKVEYTIGYHHEGDKEIPTVGFNIRGWSGGVCIPTTDNAPHVPKEGCDIAAIFHTFLQDSALPVYENKTHDGVWRNVTIRISKSMNQCMIVVLHAPPEKKHNDILEKEKLRLVDMLTKDNNSKDFKVTSIYYQEYDGLSNPTPNDTMDDKLKHYYGEKTFQEKLKSCVYTISPFGSFFQVNTKGAEVLYDIVIKHCKEAINDGSSDGDDVMEDAETKDTNDESNEEEIAIDQDSIDSKNGDDTENSKETKKKKVILLDVCCGTGTIGLTCLKEKVVDYVVGIDISEPAIRDAIINAKNNGFHVVTNDSDLCEDDDEEKVIPKVKFIASKAEAVIGSVISNIYKLYDEEDVHIVAVVDPARDGLHNSVLKTLRNTSSIQRIIYVSCNPTGSLINDAKILCGVPTNKYVGMPFRPVVAQPVDMFPWTNHCELVMVFDRNNDFDETDFE